MRALLTLAVPNPTASLPSGSLQSKVRAQECWRLVKNPSCTAGDCREGGLWHTHTAHPVCSVSLPADREENSLCRTSGKSHRQGDLPNSHTVRDHFGAQIRNLIQAFTHLVYTIPFQLQTGKLHSSLHSIFLRETWDIALVLKKITPASLDDFSPLFLGSLSLQFTYFLTIELLGTPDWFSFHSLVPHKRQFWPYSLWAQLLNNTQIFTCFSSPHTTSPISITEVAKGNPQFNHLFACIKEIMSKKPPCLLDKRKRQVRKELCCCTSPK